MSFITELWELVFTPGTTPALVKATHASFILLILSLISLIFLSGSIHFVNLLVIALFLYGAVIWFINELETVKLRSNEQLEEAPEETTDPKSKGVEESAKSTEAVAPTAATAPETLPPVATGASARVTRSSKRKA